MASSSDSAATAPSAPDSRASTPLDARYRLLFESNPVPLGVLSIATQRYLFVNAAAERVFGYGPGEMVELDAALVIDPSAHQLLAESLATQSPELQQLFTVPMRRKDGSLIYCDAAFQRVEYAGEVALLVTATDVTSRVEAEQALERSEALFRDGFERATVPTLMLDAQGNCLRVNLAATALLRRDAAAVVGRPLLDLIHPDCHAEAEAIARHLRGEPSQPLPLSTRLIRGDGETAWVLASVAALGGPDGGFLAELVDQTDLHHAMQALRESEERHAFALDATTDGVWDWNVVTGRIITNARWFTMLGFEPLELQPSIATWEALAHPDDAPKAYAQLDAHARGEIPMVELEMRMRTKGGDWLWILNRAKIVESAPDGAPMRVVGTHSDIHLRRLQDAAMRTQAALLDTVLSNIPIAIDIIGSDGRVEYVNAFAERLLGWTLEEMRTQDVMARLYPDPLYRAKVYASISEGSPEWRDWRIHTRSGEILTMSWANVRLPDGRAIGMGTDVTSLRAAEEAEARHEEQLRAAQKLESLGLLAGGIAHDFNNLLVGVLGNASLAEEQLPPNSDVRELIVEVRAAATRAAELTRQLLAYAGKGRFVVEPVDVSGIVSEMAALLRAAVSKRAVLQQDLARDLPNVQADATQLRQVVMNLITNASDALRDGEGTITLRTALREPDERERRAVAGGTALAPGRYVCLEVSDTGSGMSPDTLQRIFDPFFTTKRNGHGLGLAATLGIVRSHRGAIAVESAVSEGTTIRLYLPAVAAARRSGPTPQVGAVAALRGSGRILLADDEPAVRDVARRALERTGFTVTACNDGADALDRFREDPSAYRAVVLDLTMPILGGQDALLAMRAIRRDIPAVLSSGFASEELSPAVTRLDAVTFVQKPFTVNTLTAAIFEVAPPDAA